MPIKPQLSRSFATRNQEFAKELLVLRLGLAYHLKAFTVLRYNVIVFFSNCIRIRNSNSKIIFIVYSLIGLACHYYIENCIKLFLR